MLHGSEIFNSKNNMHKNFVSFDLQNFLKGSRLQYGRAPGKFLELVYYQVSEEPGITDCCHQSDIYLRGCKLAHTLIL